MIREAMRQKTMAALGRLVLSKREPVIALEPYGKGLLGTTLRYPYEVRDAKDYFGDLPELALAREPAPVSARSPGPARLRSLLAGPLHDNKKHAKTPKGSHEPKDRTLEPGTRQTEDRRRLERHHHHRPVSDQPTEGDRRAGRKQH